MKQGQLIPLAREELLQKIREAKSRIWLASPFLTLPIAEMICEEATKSKASNRRLLTSLEPRSVRVGVLDPKGISRLIEEAEFEVSHLDNLHAKVSLIDTSWGLVGSGNLTGKGLGGSAGGANHELGVVLSAAQRRSAARIFGQWWKQAELASRELIAQLDKIERLPRVPNRKRGPVLPTFDVAGLERALAENDPGREYFADANYHSNANEAWWRDRKWISSPRYVHYAKGDLIVIYLGAKNRGPKRCPAIVRATTDTEENEKFVARYRDTEPASRWPNVTQIEILAEASPVTAGIELELVKKTGRSLQRGSCKLTSEQFKTLAQAMIKGKQRV